MGMIVKKWLFENDIWDNYEWVLLNVKQLTLYWQTGVVNWAYNIIFTFYFPIHNEAGFCLAVRNFTARAFQLIS